MKSFWPAHFQQPPTRAQRIFDIFFGLLAPVLCILLDPGLLSRTDYASNALFSPFRLLVYFEILIGLSALAYYLFVRRPSYSLAGILYACALFSFVVGVVIFPFTLLFLLALIGAFGLIPFVTSFVFARNAHRCMHEAAQNAPSSRHPFLLALPTLVLTLAIPFALQLSANHLASQAMHSIEAGTSPNNLRAIQTLKWMRDFIDVDELAAAYELSSDPAKRQRLADAFQSITGRSIEVRLQKIHD